MIKGALEYLVNLGQVKTLEIDGQTYSTEGLHRITPPMAQPLEVNTLSGLTEYILSKFDEEAHVGKLVHVMDHSKVCLMSQLLSSGKREDYVIAEAFSPQFRFGAWYDLEGFNIGLQSCFVRNEDAEQILRVVGNIKDSAVKQFGDDGVTQQVTVKAGVAVVDDVEVPNPVILAPYRTFIEVDQPESKFIFRMRQGGGAPECALFEADGGAWKLEAMARVKAFLMDRLADTGISVIS